MVCETEYYDQLGVAPTADESQIKRAYKRMALKYHPDKCKEDDAEAKFKALAEAYEVLSDSEKRKVYDEKGKAGLEDDGRGGGDFNASDIFSAFFGGRKPRGEPKPKDIVHELEVPLSDFYLGRTKQIAATRDRLCETCTGEGVNPSCGRKREEFRCQACGGRGARLMEAQIAPGFVQRMQVRCDRCSGSCYAIPQQNRCPECKGRQVLKVRKVLDVHIEKGMKRGDVITFSGEGDQVPGIRLSGDIMIVLGQKENEFFQRRGRHLFVEHEITLAEALTGFQLPIAHLDGRQLLIRTRPGQVIDPQRLWVIDREGMPVKGSGGLEKGSLVLNLKVRFPVSLSVPQVHAIHESLGEPEQVERTEEHEEYQLEDYRPRRRQQRGRGHGGMMFDDGGHGHGGGGAPQVQCAHQ
eukprot:Hpha_TRINITY_DN12392_c0_g2::TRINITY_DN12392_c0_g2_i1::g.155864::m.155864/K09502/DNAJA1; DnaJ homolog subfamily A member 1